MEIKKYYKKSNEISDMSGDYVEIKMPSEMYQRVMSAISLMSFYSNKNSKKWECLEKAIREAEEKGEKVWY